MAGILEKRKDLTGLLAGGWKQRLALACALAIGAQGVQNGGIDSASVAGAVPSGVRSLMAENLMVMLRNLEACTGNDALMSESDVRRTSRTHPIFIGGSDFICSGFGSIPRSSLYATCFARRRSVSPIAFFIDSVIRSA